MYAGPETLPRENTNTWPFELVATPAISPKWMSGGKVSGSATDSNGNSGTVDEAGVCVDTGNSAHPTSATVRTTTLTTTSKVGKLLRQVPR